MNYKNFRIEFVLKTPDNIQDDHVESWARFMIGDTGKISRDNPLYEEPFDPVLGSFKIEAVE